MECKDASREQRAEISTLSLGEANFLKHQRLSLGDANVLTHQR
jgi:hypothetical protein